MKISTIDSLLLLSWRNSRKLRKSFKLGLHHFLATLETSKKMMINHQPSEFGGLSDTGFHLRWHAQQIVELTMGHLPRRSRGSAALSLAPVVQAKLWLLMVISWGIWDFLWDFHGIFHWTIVGFWTCERTNLGISRKKYLTHHQLEQRHHPGRFSQRE